MAFPKKSEIRKALKDLEHAEGSLTLRENPTPLEVFRFDLCQQFIKYKHKNKITQRELSLILGVDDAKVSKILHYRIEEFSTDRLIDLCTRIDPNLRLKIG